MPLEKTPDDCDLDPAVAEEARKIREIGFVDDEGNPVLDSDGRFRGPWDARTEKKRRPPNYRDLPAELLEVISADMFTAIEAKKRFRS